MFLRMLWRAAILRKGRAATALLAMVVGAAVATTMLNLFIDVQAKLRTEFRTLQKRRWLGVAQRFPSHMPWHAPKTVNPWSLPELISTGSVR